MSYILLADVLAVVHLAWVAVVVFGLLLILIGGPMGWKWTRNRWVRGIHMAMIALVVMRTTVWKECPITTWERDLRALAGQNDFEGSPIGKICHDLIHPPTSPDLLWIYPVIYAVFGLLVLGTFWLVPVEWGPRKEPA